jgi:hypothetical protein
MLGQRVVAATVRPITAARRRSHSGSSVEVFDRALQRHVIRQNVRYDSAISLSSAVVQREPATRSAIVQTCAYAETVAPRGLVHGRAILYAMGG